MNPATPAAGGPEIGPCLLMTSWLVDWLVSWFDCGLVSWGFLVFLFTIFVGLGEVGERWRVFI